MVPQMKNPLRLKIVLKICYFKTVTENFDTKFGLLINDQLFSNELRIATNPSLEYTVNQI